MELTYTHKIRIHDTKVQSMLTVHGHRSPGRCQEQPVEVEKEGEGEGNGQEEEGRLVPQLRLSEDGSIVVDENSMVIETTGMETSSTPRFG